MYVFLAIIFFSSFFSCNATVAQLKWSLVMLKKTFHTQTSSDQHIFKKKMEKNAHEYFVGHIKWCKQTDQIDVTWHNMHTPYHIYEMMDERREKFHIDFLCTRHLNRVCRYNQSNGNKVLRTRTHIWRKKVWRARERKAAAVPEKSLYHKALRIWSALFQLTKVHWFIVLHKP